MHDKNMGLGGQETIFDFKYVPQLGLTTSPDGPEDVQRVNKRKGPSTEHRSLATLVLATALMGTVTWFSMRSAVRMFQSW